MEGGGGGVDPESVITWRPAWSSVMCILVHATTSTSYMLVAGLQAWPLKVRGKSIRGGGERGNNK